MQIIKQIRKSFLGINNRNLGYIYPGNLRKYHKLANDKSLTKVILEQNDLACPETYAIIDSLGEIETAWKSVTHLSELVIKPGRGHGGNGILILKKKQGKWYSGKNRIKDDEIYYHIANIIYGTFALSDQDVAIIEEFIFPPQFFRDIYADGVPDIRIILHKNRPVLSMLRMPTSISKGKANLHQGGLAIGIDMLSGTLTEAFNGKKYYDFHPDSLVEIKGKVLPYWNELVQLSIATSEVFPLDYLGIDIILDRQKGPLVMEINLKPGLGIQLANKKGLKSLLEIK